MSINTNPAAASGPRAGLIVQALDANDLTSPLLTSQASWPAKQLSTAAPQPNREAVEVFLREQVKIDIHLVSIEPDGPGVNGRYFGDDAAEAAKWAAAENTRGRNVYWTVNRVWAGCHRKPTKADIVEARFIHADIDPPKNGSFDRDAKILSLDVLPCPPSFVADSGNGLQAVWRLDPPTPAWQEVEAINRGAEAALGADHCHNIDRLLRVPGTINYPNKKKRAAGRVPVLAKSLGVYGKDGYPAEELAKIFPPRQASKNDEGNLVLGSADLLTADDLDLPDRELIRAAIECPKGEDRSADGYRCACLMLHAGATPEQVAGILLNPQNAVSGHYLEQASPDRAVRRVIERARAAVKVEFPPIEDAAVTALAEDAIELADLDRSDGYRRIDFNDEDDLSAIRDPLVEGFFDRGSVAIVYGKSGVGKSFLMMRLAWHIAAGEPWAGQFVTQGPVLYVVVEGREGLPRRKAALRKVVGNARVPLRFITLNVDLGAGGAATAKRIVREVRLLERDVGQAPVMVVIDTISASMMKVDSSAAGEASAVVGRLKQVADTTGATCIGIYHPGKNEDNGPLGSYLFTANIDSQVQVRTGEIEVQKERDGPKARPIGFALDLIDLGFTDTGRPINSLVARILDRPAVDASTAERELRGEPRELLRLARDMARHLDLSQDSVGLTLHGIAEEAIARKIRKPGKTPKSTRDSVQKTLKNLEAVQLMKYRNGLWLPTEFARQAEWEAA